MLRNATEEYLQNSKFYITTPDGKEHRIVINNQKDLCRYYPHLVHMMHCSNGESVVHLSSISFIDREEEEMISWIKRDLVKYYNKCKRNKIHYDPDEALEKVIWGKVTEYERILAQRVGEKGEKASIVGLHRSIHDYYRERWFEEMIRQGYTENEADYWIYGWNEKPRRKGYDKEESKKNETGKAKE